MTTRATEQARNGNLPFWFVHIEGLPYLWFTIAATGWAVPSGWTYSTGFEIEGVELDLSIDPLEGVQDAESLSLRIWDTALDAIMALGRNTQGTMAQITSNSIAHGTNSDLVTSRAITGAAAGGGTVYLGNQTITYTSRTTTTFAGVDRGRYAYLDSSLDEVKWPSRIEWVASLGVAPLLSVYPRTMEGRTVTLYRNYFHTVTGLPLAKSQSEVRWRGQLSAWGQTEDGMGWEMSCTSLMDRLNGLILADNVGEHNIKGYALTGKAYTDVAGTKEFDELYITEQGWRFPTTDPDDDYLDGAYHFTHQIDIGNPGYYDTPDALISAVNSALSAAWTAGTTLAPWFCQRGSDGRVQIGYHALGFSAGPTPGGHIAKGATGSTPAWGVVGRVRVNPLVVALGIGSEIGSAIDVVGFDRETYRHMFALWTNPTEYSAMLIAGGPLYAPASVTGESEVYSTWMALDGTRAIPLDMPDASSAYVETIGDGGRFLVKAGDSLIYNAGAVNTVATEVLLLQAKADYDNPIGTRERPDDSFLAITETEAIEGIDVPTARQVYEPTGRHKVAIDDTLSEYIYGVQYTLLQLMLSTGTAAANGAFDVLPAGWALEIPAAFVDTDSFEALGDIYPAASLQRSYLLDESQSFMDLIAAEAKTLGFWIGTKAGQIRAVPIGHPSVLDIDASIDTAEIISSKAQSNPDGVRNLITLNVDWDWKAGEFRRDSAYHDLASQMDTRSVQTLEVENKGIRSAQFGGASDDTVDEADLLMVDRLAQLTTDVIHYVAVVSNRADEVVVGDVVKVTDPTVMNPTTGTRGITGHLGRVVSARFDEGSGEGELQIRLSLDATVDPYVSAGDVFGKVSVFNPAHQMDSISGAEITLGSKWDGNYADFTWMAGEKVQIVDMQTGDKEDLVVVSHVGDLLTVAVAPTGVSYDAAYTVITAADHDDLDSPGGHEKRGTFLADENGELDANSAKVAGYRLS